MLLPLIEVALAEVEPASFAGWVVNSLPTLLTEIRVDDVVVSFTTCELDGDPRQFGTVRLTVRLVFFADGVIFDVKEQELLFGGLAPEDFKRPAPDPSDPHLAGALALWRTALAEKLRACSEPQCLMPADLIPGELPLPALILTWLDHGPPGPRPQRVRPRPGTLIRSVDPAAFAAVDRAVLAAYACDGWHILLAPHVPRPDSFEEDRLWVVPPDGDPVLVLMSDPWDAPVAMTIDGDAVAFRGFATWLREAILGEGLDVEWHHREFDDDDDDDEPQVLTRRISDWLRFRDGWREEQGERLWDWRVQAEMVADGWAFWQSGIYGFTAERARAHEAKVATWRRFLTEVLDSSS